MTGVSLGLGPGNKIEVIILSEAFFANTAFYKLCCFQGLIKIPTTPTPGKILRPRKNGLH